MNRIRVLKATVLTIALVQLALGAGYLLAAPAFDGLLGLSQAPAWTNWPLGMLGARYLALGAGMLMVYRDPIAHRSWVAPMVLVQALDWLATIVNLASGSVTLGQVTTASFLPLVFIAGLLVGYPRGDRAATTSPRAAARRP